MEHNDDSLSGGGNETTNASKVRAVHRILQSEDFVSSFDFTCPEQFLGKRSSDSYGKLLVQILAVELKEETKSNIMVN